MPTIETLINPIKLSDVTSLDDNDSDMIMTVMTYSNATDK